MAEPTTPCCFLDKLPAEIRIQIYQYVLPSNQHSKLRQYIEGTFNLSILRTNHQIHSEAQEVLYNSNIITAARNDFCSKIDPDLKTPIQFSRVRHLCIVSFNASIACTLLDALEKCDVCRTDAGGLLRCAAEMPDLKDIVIEHANLLTTAEGLWALRREGGLMGVDVTFDLDIRPRWIRLEFRR